ncbi:hypothetical protein C440_10458 [Haloferax mucosum ATCC BAA-1512]|uniref:Uncharacterized protein n=1 Tax=Haloferax mucosum ATCC BAA-1512 TaxID=662479 RepID=M0IB77_9EURY|nr:hypothetical protein C440_10458 [Haloferax mucosum ATCC BAA-1512]
MNQTRSWIVILVSSAIIGFLFYFYATSIEYGIFGVVLSIIVLRYLLIVRG